MPRTTKSARLLALLLLSVSAYAQNTTVLVWNGLPDTKALFYGYLSLQGGLPIARGSTLWIPVDKGEFRWSMPAVSPADKKQTLSGDFNLDPNLFYDQQHNPGQLLVPHWKTSIHCQVTLPSRSPTLTVLFVENPPGSASKYGCVIQ